MTWGNFTGTVPDLETGSPASPSGVTAGKSLERRIDRGCATYLDVPADTTFDSAADFTEQTPTPRNNGVTPTETTCPETRIATNPANPNNSTAATFTFDSPGNTSPVPPGLSFRCKLDTELDFSACESPRTYAGGLTEGTHTFSVKAVLNGVEDPTPATYMWTIDRTPPDTTITEGSKPANPTASQTANLGFTSSEPNSTFTCKLDTGAEESCNSGSKQYSGLASGSHTFTVFATDRAGNKDDVAPATYTWFVDRTPPDTAIDTGPTQPVSTVNTATFTYHSEAGATFKCKLDTQAETDCNGPSGIAYSSLGEGQHTFRVYSIDALGNSETLAGAATYTWTVDAVVGPPDTEITKAPKRKGKDRTPTIQFEASEAPVTFECRVDGKPYAACTSPHTTKKLKIGKHTFDVKATGAGGEDPTPARVSFKIVKKR